MKEISKTYNPKGVEDKIYKIWEESGFFNPDNLNLDKKAEKFVISMPPPNATGILHLGHASALAYQDLMIRYNRMRGRLVLWLPGTDHASIATQNRVEKLIAKKGETKYDLGREKFLKKVHQYIENSRNSIREQIKKMGSSCDWSRERYTLDKGLSRAVREVFVKMYNDGLIYRGNRIVNWCPGCESTLADDEVEYRKEKTAFYYFKYGPVIIGTARPETKFADKIIVVHPDDKRYKHLIGKNFIVPWINGKIKATVIADKTIDKDFGTGAMTITPAHSFEDFKLAQKYGFEIVKIIDEKGRLTDSAGEFSKMNAREARKAIVAKMKKIGLVRKIDQNYVHNLSICYRCHCPVEPLISLQWFVNVNKKILNENNRYFKNKSLKDVGLNLVKENEIKIIPKRFEKVYYHWMENLQDWCISRQIWFGHRIPVWWCNNPKCEFYKDKPIVSVYSVKKCPYCNSRDVKKDPDTLDTWFSSGIWTFSTLLNKNFKNYKTFEEWVENSPDLKRFHPTSVMETGYDILFFWVARMILMTSYVLGEVPFEKVYLHGMVRDRIGRKMSKSLGNGIDPIEMIEKYGTDALRISIVIGSSPGNDLRLYEKKIKGCRNFINKLWNISRYILMNVKEAKIIEKIPEAKTLADKWILNRLYDLNSFTKDLEEFRFSLVANNLYRFTWNQLADWYLEIAKIEKNKDEILLYILEKLLILWHPLAPFITEKIWENFNTENLLIKTKWDLTKNLKKPYPDIDDEFKIIQNIIEEIRLIKIKNKIKPVKKIDIIIIPKKQKFETIIKRESEIIKSLARIKGLEIHSKFIKKEGSILSALKNFDIYLLKD